MGLNATPARTRFKHGYAGRRSYAPEYKVWTKMRQRCGNSNDTAYSSYGARGIKVCERWDSFESFMSDMGPRPAPNMTIDRIDNNKGYSPENCRWASRAEQAQNRRITRMITAFGETRPLSAWAKQLGVGRHVLYKRLRLGWPSEKAVSTPVTDSRFQRQSTKEK